MACWELQVVTGSQNTIHALSGDWIGRNGIQCKSLISMIILDNFGHFLHGQAQLNPAPFWR